jgi:hypothetical protein
MSATRVLLGAAIAGALAGCGASATSSTPPQPTPSPKPGQPAPAGPEPSAPGRGPAVTYRPVRSAAYRLERHDSLTLQYPGGATQQQVRDRVAFLHLGIADAGTAGVYRVTVVLDSLQALENGESAAPDSIAAARGTRWTASLTESGGLSGLTPDRTGTLPDELTGRLLLLFPALPTGGVREGMEWTDTTEYHLTADAFPGSERVVTTYRAGEGSTPGGKAITLQSTGAYTRTGTRVQADQELQMKATGTRRGTHQLGRDGVLVSAQGNEVGDMTITVPTVGQTVPVKQSGSYAITSLSPR